MSNVLKSTTVGICLSVLLVTPALAADGLYAGAAVGFTQTPDTTASGTSGGNVTFDNSTQGSVFVGQDYGENWRAEAEVARRAADVGSVAGTAGSGEALATTVMLNVLYDVNTATALTPYVGLGAGFANVAMNNATPFGGSTLDDSDTAAAFQAIGGVSYEFTDQINLFADYRYLKTASVDLATQAGTSTSLDFSSHSALFGVRFSFGGSGQNGQSGAMNSLNSGATRLATNNPEPMVQAQAPVPTAMPQQVAALPERTLPDTYVVHFALNKTNLSPADFAIIEQAAQNAKTMKLVRIDLTGHTDSSGDAAYNVRLSKRRGEVVKAAFVVLGFDAAEIKIKALGEINPYVGTGDNKYEPKNRRVEIVLP